MRAPSKSDKYSCNVVIVNLAPIGARITGLVEGDLGARAQVPQHRLQGGLFRHPHQFALRDVQLAAGQLSAVASALGQAVNRFRL